MARTKQTGRKEQVKNISAGGLPLALSNSSSWSGDLSSPFNVKESRETSELSCDSLNLTGFISDPTQKLVELAHLTKSGRWDYEGGHLEQKIPKDFRFES